MLALQHIKSPGEKQPLFCIPLLQCIRIQEMLVAHWQTLNQLHGPKHPITTFSDSENMTFLVFSQDGHHWKIAAFYLARCHGILLKNTSVQA